MNLRKTVNGLANDEAKHRDIANKYWKKSKNKHISSKRAQSLKRKAKIEYCKADSIRTAQANLPTINSNTSVSIGSNNKVKTSKTNKTSISFKFNKKTKSTKCKN